MSQQNSDSASNIFNISGSSITNVVGSGTIHYGEAQFAGGSESVQVSGDESSGVAKTILFLAANPRNMEPMRLDEQVREIEAGLQRAKHRDRFLFEQRWAVRPRDVQRAMLDLKPQIVQFSGRGAFASDGLWLEDETGQAKPVSAVALAALFALFSHPVQCVVLNACYSEIQAEAIARHIPYVIGMSDAIGDRAAIEFAVAFYDALGAGESIEFAYRLGVVAIQMAGIPEDLVPVLKRKYSDSHPQ